MSSKGDSSQTAQGQAVSAEDVGTYLQANPDFFVEHEHLLRRLNIPHDSGRATSLLEYQVKVLRREQQTQQKDMQKLITQADTNDMLFEKTRLVVLALLKGDSLQALGNILCRELSAQFDTDASALMFVCDDDHPLPDVPVLPCSQAIKGLGELFEKRRTWCGRLRADRASLFFEADTASRIASAAIVPIHLSTEDIEKTGRRFLLPVMVLGSEQADYFHSSQETLFLDFIGEVLAALMRRFLPGV